VFFLSETHLEKARADNLMRKLGFDKSIIFESDGQSGGLLMLWRNNVKIIGRAATKNYIDVIIEDDITWRFTGFYGEPSWGQKHISWEALRTLHGQVALPWLVLGDFNEILFNYEKEGGRPRSQLAMKAFHDALNDCELEDMGYVGDLFTWRRGKLRERLDRGVVNDQWNACFPFASLINSETTRSDHRPLLVDTEYLSNTHGSTDRPRRFEARWLQEDVVEEMVKAAWERAKARGVEISLMEKCNDVHSELHTWDRDVLKGPARKLKELKRDLEQLRRGPMTDAALAAQKEIQLQIEITLEKEEMFWVQRARANWLKHGDRNTNFFHRMASKRKKQNTIKFLMDDNGIKHEDKDSMCDVVYNYFSDLFTSEVPAPELSVFEDVHTLVTEEMNRGLLAPFTVEEVKKALFQIGDLKAPGPDGLHSIFYKRFWEMLGDDLTKEVLEAIDNISVPEGWNNGQLC
jgi:hypothetical protein